MWGTWHMQSMLMDALQKIHFCSSKLLIQGRKRSNLTPLCAMCRPKSFSLDPVYDFSKGKQAS